MRLPLKKMYSLNAALAARSRATVRLAPVLSAATDCPTHSTIDSFQLARKPELRRALKELATKYDSWLIQTHTRERNRLTVFRGVDDRQDRTKVPRVGRRENDLHCAALPGLQR